MIFLSEQPQTGMNEGTWLTQGMCIKNEGIICREEKPGALGAEGDKKKGFRCRKPFVCIGNYYFFKNSSMKPATSGLSICLPTMIPFWSTKMF